MKGVPTHQSGHAAGRAGLNSSPRGFCFVFLFEFGWGGSMGLDQIWVFLGSFISSHVLGSPCMLSGNAFWKTIKKFAGMGDTMVIFWIRAEGFQLAVGQNLLHTF